MDERTLNHAILDIEDRLEKLEGKEMKIEGYTTQSDENMRLVNINKHLEEEVLNALDNLELLPFTNPRWLSIARTDLQKAFMAMNRAIMQPERIDAD